VKPRVLVVDDSMTVRMDLRDAFESAGFETTLCPTGADARDAIARQRFSLVVLDLLLPDADGIELLREMKNRPSTARTPVMILSAETDVGHRARGAEIGAAEYVGKPYDRSYVVSRAREIVREGEGSGSAEGAPTVLVIDDSVTYRETLRAALEAAGYAAIAAATGEEGLRAAADARPDAVIVDGALPGIDGATVVRRLRLDDALRRTPCLFLTSADDRGTELKALDSGADAFVRKDEELAVLFARLAAALRSAGPRDSRATASVLGPKRILAVDDSPTYLNGLGDALRDEGYDVVLASSGDEALELLPVVTADCVLLDLRMPGMSGEEACRRIKSSPVHRDIPVIVLTAVEDRETMLRSINLGADDYIPKSGDFEVVKARLRAQLRRKQFEDENRRIREELLRREMHAAEAEAARKLADTRARLLEDLRRKNEELDAFSYSVAHDLRAPLRAIDGFGQALLEDCADRLDEAGKGHLSRIRAAAQRMGDIIADLLTLSRISRADLHRSRLDLAALSRGIVDGLRDADPDRDVGFSAEAGIEAHADESLIVVLLENLIRNAWKFTRKRAKATIELRALKREGGLVYCVRDDGAGFDMKFADKLFRPFQRLHPAAEYEGTGIGLAIVRRIVEKHGGEAWAESEPERGAAFFFTLGQEPNDDRSRNDTSRRGQSGRRGPDAPGAPERECLEPGGRCP